MGDVAVAAGHPAATAGRDPLAAAVADLTEARVAGAHSLLEDILHFERNPPEWPLEKLSSFFLDTHAARLHCANRQERALFAGNHESA